MIKKWVKKYKEINSKPRGKAFFFFLFYFIFFTIIIVYLKSTKPVSYDSSEELSTFPFESSQLTLSNYHFKYSEIVDGERKDIVGEEIDNQITFTYQDNLYSYDGIDYSIKKDIWEKCDKPISYYDFVNSYSLYSLLQNAYLDSETTYKSGKVTYHFFVDTNLIYQVLWNKNTDYDLDMNSIIVNFNEEKVLDSILLEWNPYCKSSNLCRESLKVEIHYDKVNERKQ